VAACQIGRKPWHTHLGLVVRNGPILRAFSLPRGAGISYTSGMEIAWRVAFSAGVGGERARG